MAEKKEKTGGYPVPEDKLDFEAAVAKALEEQREAALDFADVFRPWFEKIEAAIGHPGLEDPEPIRRLYQDADEVREAFERLIEVSNP